MKIISIAAVTAGGKTTIVNEIKKQVKNVMTLHFDDYAFEGEVDDFYGWGKNGANYNEWNLSPLINDICKIKDSIQKREKAHIGKKIFGIVFFIIVFSAVAYFSGCRDFNSTFFHVFILFLVVNLFDLFVLDVGIFCHSKKLRIPGTEDMKKEYKYYFFHAKGAFIGTLLGVVIALASAGIIKIIS